MATSKSKRKLLSELEQARILFTPTVDGGPVTECRILPHWLYTELLEALGRKQLEATTHERVA